MELWLQSRVFAHISSCVYLDLQPMKLKFSSHFNAIFCSKGQDLQVLSRTFFIQEPNTSQSGIEHTYSKWKMVQPGQRIFCEAQEGHFMTSMRRPQDVLCLLGLYPCVIISRHGPLVKTTGDKIFFFCLITTVSVVIVVLKYAEMNSVSMVNACCFCKSNF